jgi:hypothetical protein
MMAWRKADIAGSSLFAQDCRNVVAAPSIARPGTLRAFCAGRRSQLPVCRQHSYEGNGHNGPE